MKKKNDDPPKPGCDCITQTGKLCDKQLREDIGEDNIYRVESSRYENIGFSMSGGPTRIGMPYVLTYYRKRINHDRPARNKTTKTISVYPTFCPFCGEKYPEEVKRETIKL